jgi:hypothetical protein
LNTAAKTLLERRIWQACGGRPTRREPENKELFMETRPVGVTVVGILIVIAGILGIVVGILGFVSGETAGWGIAILITSLIVGLIYLLVAKGIFNGNRGSRLIVAIFTVIGIITGFFALFTSFSDGLVRIVWGVVIMALLYAGKAKAFFAN